MLRLLCRLRWIVQSLCDGKSCAVSWGLGDLPLHDLLEIFCDCFGLLDPSYLAGVTPFSSFFKFWMAWMTVDWSCSRRLEIFQELNPSEWRIRMLTLSSVLTCSLLWAVSCKNNKVTFFTRIVMFSQTAPVIKQRNLTAFSDRSAVYPSISSLHVPPDHFHQRC